MGEHAVQIYDGVGGLAESVAAHLVAGFEAGEPAVVAATRDHWRHVAERLVAQGWDPGTLEAPSLLAVADAEETLAAFMRDGRPSPSAFEQVVGALLDQASARSPRRRVRVFGEMVDLLCRRGEPDAAVALEGLWNKLARTRRFSLLCGYRLDLFDHAMQVGLVPEICRVHTSVLPAHDQARLARAVDHALDDVLGPVDAGKVYVLVGREIREGRIPPAQLALMWVSANLPAMADRILAIARRHYARTPVASAVG